MGALRARIADAFRTWRAGRYQQKRAANARRDQQAADELDRASAGVDRFPPMGGGI